MSTRFKFGTFTNVKDINRTRDDNQLIHDWPLSCLCTLLISALLFWFLILVVLTHSLNSSYGRSRNTFFYPLLPHKNVNFRHCNKFYCELIPIFLLLTFRNHLLCEINMTPSDSSLSLDVEGPGFIYLHFSLVFLFSFC